MAKTKAKKAKKSKKTTTAKKVKKSDLKKAKGGRMAMAPMGWIMHEPIKT